MTPKKPSKKTDALNMEDFEAWARQASLFGLVQELITLRFQGVPDKTKAKILWQRKLLLIQSSMDMFERPPMGGKVHTDVIDVVPVRKMPKKVRTLGSAFKGV